MGSLPFPRLSEAPTLTIGLQGNCLTATTCATSPIRPFVGFIEHPREKSYNVRVGFGLFISRPAIVYADRSGRPSSGYRRATNGVQVPRHHRSPRPGETEFVAGNASAAKTRKVRRLAEPSGCKVGQKGARLHMQGQGVERGQERRTPGRRRATALVLAALVAYHTLGALSAAPALFVVVHAQLSVDGWGQGEPGIGDKRPDYRRATNGVQVPRHHRSPRPGETEFVAGNASAAKTVRSRTAEGTRQACGELGMRGGRDGFDRS